MPLMNQEYNLSVPSNMAAQQYQWNADNYFDFSVCDLSEPSLSRGHPSESAIGLMQQNQFSSAVGNNQSNFPRYGSQGVGGE
jgi:hypothetical protein